MFHEFVRQMTEPELKELSNTLQEIDRGPMSVSHTMKWTAAWGAGFIICGILEAALLMNVGVHHVVLRSGIAGIVAVAMIVCLYAIIMLARGHFYWRGAYRKARSERAPLVRSALSSGRVRVKKVVASSVIVIEPLEPDAGSGYVFDIGNGEILFLKGQKYYPVTDEMEWPNADFEIVRSEPGDLWVGVFCYGRKLKPLDVIPISSCRDDRVQADREEVLATTLEEFRGSLTVLA